MEIKEKINEIIKAEISTLALIEGDMSLENDLGLDSLRRVQVICNIEDAFNIQIEIEDLHPKNFIKVSDLYNIVTKYVR